MDVILESSYEAGGGKALTVPYELDLSINGTHDFQLSQNYQYFDKSLGMGTRLYVPGTEYGGIVQDISGATNTDKVTLHGYTWRGILSRHFIEPPPGEDYYDTGDLSDLNDIINNLIVYTGLDNYGLFAASPKRTIQRAHYKFDRYISIADGLEKMLESYGYRLNIRWIPTQLHYDFTHGVSVMVEDGYCELGAVPVKNYGSEIEVSQDSKIDFYSQDYRMGVNHLICLGTGRLAQRTVVHLYADADGNISKTQTFFGVDEIAEVFENPSADADTLEETGISRFQQLLNFKKFTADAKYIDDINLSIGDTITGKDLITGTVVTKPIRQKIVKITNGIPSVEYTI